MVDVTRTLVGVVAADVVTVKTTCPTVVATLAIWVWGPIALAWFAYCRAGGLGGKGSNELHLGGRELYSEGLDAGG